MVGRDKKEYGRRDNYRREDGAQGAGFPLSTRPPGRARPGMAGAESDRPGPGPDRPDRARPGPGSCRAQHGRVRPARPRPGGSGELLPRGGNAHVAQGQRDREARACGQARVRPSDARRESPPNVGRDWRWRLWLGDVPPMEEGGPARVGSSRGHRQAIWRLASRHAQIDSADHGSCCATTNVFWKRLRRGLRMPEPAWSCGTYPRGRRT